MNRNLSSESLGISGRQSEIIELTLTHKFNSFDLNFADFAKRSTGDGKNYALACIESADLEIGSFAVSFDWEGAQAGYKGRLEQFKEDLGFLEGLKAPRCLAVVKPASDELPYDENFELHCERLGEIAEVLKAVGVRLGIGFDASPKMRAERKHEFICDFEGLLKLVEGVKSDNVGILLDTWNWHVGNGAMDQISTLAVDDIVCVRVADLADDANLAEDGAKARLLPQETGVVDSVSVIKYLAANDYDGPVAAYPHPSHFSGMGRESIVSRTAASLDKLWIAAGLKEAPPEPEPAPEEEAESADGAASQNGEATAGAADAGAGDKPASEEAASDGA